MPPLQLAFTLTLIAGMAMPIGATVAHFLHIKPRWLEREILHGITAFGGGALLSAVALVLVPEGILSFSPFVAAMLFLFGGIGFMLLDYCLSKRGTSMSQLVAMMSDFIPESLALGASVAAGNRNAMLITLLIVMQNIPEGFNAFRELRDAKGYTALKIITIFFILALMGPVAGVIAYIWLSEWQSIISGIMLFAGGGILYIVFQDIAPQAVLEKHWGPPLGAVLGFALGLVGFMQA
ncbi:ZIP family metal transporter [Marinomonas mediterranea]|jgi:Predicted divalent heavy-metal cations transporter|uniref:Zinc/iron permease n=1 Tax=Marinomonas mediterranea (strain ATCC 700492 / JCM 21426 / NBRC 103028 / MMB-1) TaxID=717774 RepID=F2K0S0_MARM1|nr:ZIP family metal transporter [Marinomonas mediterranea]ADZ92162.1 zinc/iron permease [Marinomonas mediterranea MMB-1]WCN10124.1 ZIP family metal transporter [Marinomonas mediterranea]WCN14167.1 ZIP family metal transporter [Marinomonas mediterranea]WCN18222.1 ZIP family metal transporter [Marinomonas mediterranea MMB-1]